MKPNCILQVMLPKVATSTGGVSCRRCVAGGESFSGAVSLQGPLDTRLHEGRALIAIVVSLHRSTTLRHQHANKHLHHAQARCRLCARPFESVNADLCH